MFLVYREEPVAMANSRFETFPIGSDPRNEPSIEIRCVECGEYEQFFHDQEDEMQTWEFYHGMDVCPICNECNRLSHADCKDVDPFAAFYGAVAS